MAAEKPERLVKPPTVEVTERRDVESLLSLDPETLNPEFEYRFVADNKLNVSRKRMKGWRPVTKEDPERPYVEVDDAADGLIRVGDTILMRCPKEKVKRRRAEARQVAEERLAGPKRRVKGLAKKLSQERKYRIDIIDDNEEG